jgi:outer membrane protein assembly factor BamE (lipoprotein component of BamABCDE complex)
MACTTLSAENQKVNQLNAHGIRKGDSQEVVISKIGSPTMKRTIGSEETWSYIRDNRRGQRAAMTPYLLIPFAGMFVAANEINKQGGYQSSNLNVIFNPNGRVKSVNLIKTQAQEGVQF